MDLQSVTLVRLRKKSRIIEYIAGMARQYNLNHKGESNGKKSYGRG